MTSQSQDDVNLLMGEHDKVKIKEASDQRLQQTQVPQGMVKPRALETNFRGIKRGLAADRPDEGAQYPFYFATDTGVLSAWTGTAWLSTTLS